MEQLIYIENDDKQVAAKSAKSFALEEVYSRAYINSLATELAMKYLAFNNISVSNIYNMHNIRKVHEEFDLADVMLPNVKIDVRMVYDEDIIFIPKSHFEYNLVPDIYIVFKMASDASHVKFLGFFEPKLINKNNQNTDYYFIEKEKLSNPEDLKAYIENAENNTTESLSEEETENARKLGMDFVDNNISDADKRNLLNLLTRSADLRRDLVEFDNFEWISYNVVNDTEMPFAPTQPPIVNVNPDQDLMDVEDEFSAFEPDESISEIDTDMVLPDEPQIEGLEAIESAADELQISEPENVELTTEEPQTEEPETDVLTTEEPQTEESETDALTTEESQTETVVPEIETADTLTEIVSELGTEETVNSEAKETTDITDETSTQEANDFSDFSTDDLTLPAEDLNLNDGMSEAMDLEVLASDTSGAENAVIDDIQSFLGEDIQEDSASGFDELKLQDEENQNFVNDLSDDMTDEVQILDEFNLSDEEDPNLAKDLSDGITDEIQTLDELADQPLENALDTGSIEDLEFSDDLASLNDQSENNNIENIDDFQNNFNETIEEVLPEQKDLSVFEDISEPETKVSEMTEDIPAERESLPAVKFENINSDDYFNAQINPEVTSIDELFDPGKKPYDEFDNMKAEEEPVVYVNSTVISNNDGNVGEIPIDINMFHQEISNEDLDKINETYDQMLKADSKAGKKNNGLIFVFAVVIAALAGVLAFVTINKYHQKNGNGGLVKVLDDKKANNEIPDEVPPSVVHENIPEDANLPDISTKAAQIEVQEPVKAKAEASKPKVTTPQKIQKIDVPYLEVKSMNWSVPKYVSANQKFSSYINSVTNSIKTRLTTELLLVTENAYTHEFRVDVVINNDGTIKKVSTSKSSGSKQIDEVVLQTVKQTLNVMKMPSGIIVGDDLHLILKIFI